ncbi:MAG: class II aldolase/adducin family protein, partial [Clostridiales bacterium]|nr:class II aldolase/adducin family protein [Clostridiales bacterium]
MKNILEAPFMVEMIRTTTNMYNHGWDERNAGNISLMVDEEDVREYLDTDAVLRTIPTGFTA